MPKSKFAVYFYITNIFAYHANLFGISKFFLGSSLNRGSTLASCKFIKICLLLAVSTHNILIGWDIVMVLIIEELIHSIHLVKTNAMYTIEI